jgi:hypothetical protein
MKNPRRTYLVDLLASRLKDLTHSLDTVRYLFMKKDGFLWIFQKEPTLYEIVTT